MLYDLNGNRLRKQHYHYDHTADGNMDSVIDEEESYCYNERNALTQRKNLQSVTEYIYDENGSLIKEKEGEKETGYRYDLLNRQTHVHLPDGRMQENLYDGEGLRAGLKEGNTVSTFLFYNGEILAECDGDSMPIRRHLAGAGLSHVQNLESNTFHAYHQDEQGSTAYVTGITGEAENLYSYDGFGNILESREDITNRILYTGQQYDRETGQYYLRARYYNPVIGRFTQEDTYRGDGLNLYAYCDNNPVMYYDPSGYAKQCPGQGDSEELKETEVARADAVVPDGTAGEGKLNPIQPYEVTTYEDFRKRSVVGDGLEGHELWQHANLNENGYATTRLSTDASKDNMVIALPHEVHTDVNRAQYSLDARSQTPMQNVMDNAQILYDHPSIPNDKVDELLAGTVQHVNNITGG